MPTLFVAPHHSAENVIDQGYSLVHPESVVVAMPEPEAYEDIYEQIFEDAEPSITVMIPEDGNRVAIREKPSLMAEITGYLEPGDSLQVKESDVSAWYEIVDDSRPQGFILKMHTAALEKRVLSDEN